jgi:hypothetical protein
MRVAKGEVIRQSLVVGQINSAGIQVCPRRQKQRSETMGDLFSEVSTIGDVFLLSSHRMAVKFGFLCRGHDMNISFSFTPPCTVLVNPSLNTIRSSNLAQVEKNMRCGGLDFRIRRIFENFETFSAVMRTYFSVPAGNVFVPFKSYP